MGFYERQVGSCLVSYVCGAADIRAEGEKVVSAAQGVVLEVRIGPGLNLPLYDPVRGSRVIGVDLHAAFLKLGRLRSEVARVLVEIWQELAEAMQLPLRSVDTAVRRCHGEWTAVTGTAGHALFQAAAVAVCHAFAASALNWASVRREIR